MERKCIAIGIDQSYTRTGISICVNGVLKKVTSVDFRSFDSNTDIRNKLRNMLRKLFRLTSEQGAVKVIIERIRLFSQGFVSTKYIISTGALISVIIDTADEFGIKVYSVDTRSWKSVILGSSKAGTPLKGCAKGKENAVRFVIKQGFKDSIVYYDDKKGKMYNDDAADSACIALYGFADKKKRKLNLEK